MSRGLGAARAVGVALAALSVLLLAGAGAAQAASPVQHVDRAFFNGSVSCEAAGMCVAVSQEGTASVYEGGTWTAPALVDPSQEAGETTESPKEALTSVSCVSGGFCMATGGESAFTYSAGAWSPATELVPALAEYAYVDSTSCVSQHFCMAVTTYTNVPKLKHHSELAEYLTYDGSWSKGTTVAGATGLASLSCASETFCAALDTGGNAWLYDGAEWSKVGAPGGEALASLSCPAAGRCLAGGSTGVVWELEGGAWDNATSLADDIAISHLYCASSSSCVAFSATGKAFALSGESWGVLAGGSPVSGVSCSSASSCEAVGAQGRAYSLVGSEWQQLPSIGRGHTALSCAPGTTICLLSDENGQTRRYDGIGWEATPIDGPAAFGALSCASASFCMSVGHGEAASFDGSSWGAPVPLPGVAGETLTSVSCAGSFCAAVSPNHLATYEAGAWSMATEEAGAELVSVACPIEGTCVALGAGGKTFTYGPAGWQATKVLKGASPEAPEGRDAFDAISCAAAKLCVVLLEHRKKSLSYLYDAGHWRKLTLPAPHNAAPWRALSCVSNSPSTYCEAGNLGGLTDIFEGTSWKEGPETGLWIEGLACTESSFCAAQGHEGAVVTGL